MSRIRSIKPDWLDDELVSAASSDARTLSIALICLADDYGNGRAGRVWLAGRVFPGKTLETLDGALTELATIRYALLYEVDGQRYFHLRNWDKHQRVDKPGAEKVPRPNLASAENERDKQVLHNSQELSATSQEVPGIPLASRASPSHSSGSGSRFSSELPESDPTASSGSPGAGERARRKPGAKHEHKPFTMAEAWEPEPEWVKVQVAKFGATAERIAAVLPEFRLYWRRRGEKKNQQNWERTLGNQLARLAKNGELYVEPTADRAVVNGHGHARTTRAADLLDDQLKRVRELQEAEELAEALS